MAGKKIGILAMQGAFIEHEKSLQKCGAQAVEIRKSEQLDQIDGLILPGGESTTIAKLMKFYSIDEKIRQRNAEGMPIWGTCAGMILLSKKIEHMDQDSLNLMDISVVRNGFGRQVDSFESELDIEGFGKSRGVFIRAPYVEKVWGDARVLSIYKDKIVMVEQGKCLATAFHPELTNDTGVHRYFLEKF